MKNRSLQSFNIGDVVCYDDGFGFFIGIVSHKKGNRYPLSGYKYRLFCGRSKGEAVFTIKIGSQNLYLISEKEFNHQVKIEKRRK